MEMSWAHGAPNILSCNLTSAYRKRSTKDVIFFLTSRQTWSNITASTEREKKAVLAMAMRQYPQVEGDDNSFSMKELLTNGKTNFMIYLKMTVFSLLVLKKFSFSKLVDKNCQISLLVRKRQKKSYSTCGDKTIPIGGTRRQNSSPMNQTENKLHDMFERPDITTRGKYSCNTIGMTVSVP